MTAALEGGEWSAARSCRTLPPGKTRYPFYRRLGGPQGRSGRAEKSRPHRDSIPDRPARSQSLYRLSYPAHHSVPVPRHIEGSNCVDGRTSGFLKYQCKWAAVNNPNFQSRFVSIDTVVSCMYVTTGDLLSPPAISVTYRRVR